jgi:hypothetical protein
VHKLKSHKTVGQIAKKHRLEVSFVKNQLEMGIPIEYEHTKDKDLATDIALQHLDEIPDYYTRLKKMESDAKNHHKKFKDVKEHCGCEDTAVEELEDQLMDLSDHSYRSIDRLMRRIMKKHNMTAKQLHNAFLDKNKKTPDDWIKDLKEGTLHHWFKGSKSKDGKPGWVQADGSPCANEPGETKTPKCFSSGRLRSLKKRGKRGVAIIRSAVRRKRQKDKGQQQKTGAEKPTNVPTFAKGKKDKNYIKAEPGIKEAMELNESKKDRPGKNSGKKDACYHKVKSRYDVWPSAYASASLVKCRKVGASNWGTQSEEKEMIRYCPKCQKDETRDECKYGPKYWDMFSTPSALTPNQLKYNIATVHPGNFPESYDHEHSMARSELSTIISAAKRLRKKMKGEGDIKAWVQSKITKAADYLDTAADYIDSGEMKEQVANTDSPADNPNIERFSTAIKSIIKRNLPDARKINALKQAAQIYHGLREEISFEKGKLSGPSLPLADSYEYSNWRVEFGLSEDWQKVNRQDKTDGLSPAAVKAYRRENPGSKLQTAVTEKKPKGKRAKRRASFCRRMKGAKEKLTSAKTARDPDSRINKALRRWNCN